jgi:cell division protein FtsI/penicillin-binding protein 2
MAAVAAAMANGTWRLPRIITTDAKISETPLPGVVAADLRALMGLVVTQGTAAGAGLPSGVAGKTGTAEFGNKGQTHAWFVGFRGDLAFAVLVEGGGVGGQVAAPIAADFLNRL